MEAALSVIVCNCLSCVNIITKCVLASLSVRKKREAKQDPKMTAVAFITADNKGYLLGFHVRRQSTGYYCPLQSVSQIL